MTSRRPNPIGKPDNDCDVRCGCGNLMARRTERGIEIKCRRCKRVHLIDVEEGDLMSRDPPD